MSIDVLHLLDKAGTLPMAPAATTQQSMDSAYSHISYPIDRNTSNASPSQHSLDSNTNPVPPAPPKSNSPPRLSTDYVNQPSSSKWQDETPTVERKDTIGTHITHESSTVIESFDDSILRALCDLDVRNIGLNGVISNHGLHY